MPYASATMFYAPPMPHDTIDPSANLMPGMTTISLVGGATNDQLPAQGAYLYDKQIEATTYVSAQPTGSGAVGTVTLSAALRDTIKTSSAKLTFTRAVPVLNGPVFIGATQFTVSAANTNCTSNPVLPTAVCVGDTLFYPGPCLATNTRVMSVHTPAPYTVTIDKPLLCTIATNATGPDSFLAAAPGFPDLLVSGSRFQDLGQGLATTGTNTFTIAKASTVMTATAGATFTERFNCLSDATHPPCQKSYGLFPGQTPAAGGPIPVKDLVVEGPTQSTVSHGLGTFTVTFANNDTSVASIVVSLNQTINFNTGSTSGNGYAVYIGNAPFFANVDDQIVDSDFLRTYSSPIYIVGALNLELARDTIREEYQEALDPISPPSNCIVIGSDVAFRLVDDVCLGATGAGVQIDHPVNASVLGGTFGNNYYSGMVACGAEGLNVGGGVRFIDNGQWVNQPLVQGDSVNVGLSLPAGCGDLAGVESGVQITDASFIDDQPANGVVPVCPLYQGSVPWDTQYGHTQVYGIGLSTSQPTINPIVLGTGVTFSGNICGALNPALPVAQPVTPPALHDVQVFTTASSNLTWTAPNGCATNATPTGLTAAVITCTVRVIAIGGGGGSGAGGQGSNASGGGAGGSGACEGWPNGLAFLSSNLTPTVTVAVGSAGTAGSTGTSATAGGSSGFGTYLLAAGGGRGSAGSAGLVSAGGGAAGPGGAGANAVTSTPGGGNIALGTVAGGAGASGAPNPLSANASGAGGAIGSAAAGVTALCDATGGSGGPVGGAGGGGAVATGSGTPGTVAATLIPATGSPPGGSGSTGTGSAGGACPTGGYGSSGGGGGAGTTAGGNGGASCPGYVAVVTTGT